MVMPNPKHAKRRARKLRTSPLVLAAFILGASLTTATGVMAATSTGVFSPGSFSLGCNVTKAGAISCNGSLPNASTTTTTTKPPTTTTTLPPTTTTTGPATTTTLPPTTTTTTPTGGSSCVSATATTGGNDGLTGQPPYGAFYDPTEINNSNGYNTYVNNQLENTQTGFSDKLCGTGPSSWNLTWNAPDASDNGAVQGYPDVQQLYNDWGSDSYTPLEGGPTSITSTFNTTNPSDSVGNWEMAYDLWFENYTADVMIWENTSTARGIESSYGGANILNSNVTIDGNSYTLIDYLREHELSDQSVEHGERS